MTAVEAAGLTATLAGEVDAEARFTVFGPTDEAFADVPQAALDALLGDVDALTAVLLYHVAGRGCRRARRRRDRDAG